MEARESIVELGEAAEPTPKVRQPKHATLVVLAACAGIGIAVILVGRPLIAAPKSAAESLQPVASVESASRQPQLDLVASVTRLSGQLQFRPLIPQPAPPAMRAELSGCGVASSSCVRLQAEAPGPTTGSNWVSILEGPGGCCLDGVRGNAARADVELRTGVWAHWEDLAPQYGGPILWWVDTSFGNSIYLAISSPFATREELIRIARSLVPLGALP